MKALVEASGRVADVAAEEFPVAPPYSWHDIPDGPAVAIGWTFDGTQFSAPVTASPSGVDQFAAALSVGLAIVSTGTPALNATYAIDETQQQRISGIAAGIGARNRLPGGGSTFGYPDITGTDHDFTATNFLNFAAAVEDYVYALSRGQTPSQPVTIA